MTISPPTNIYTFHLDTLGTESGKKFTGKFVYQRPTVGRRRDIIQQESMLNSEYESRYSTEPTKDVKGYNYTLAYLRVCLLECPLWFKDSGYGVELEDENVLDEISYKIKRWEDRRIEKLEQELAEGLRVKSEEQADG